MDDEPVYVTKAFMPPFEEYIETIRPLWKSAWLTNNGELHQTFEAQLLDFLKVRNVCLIANGHLALSIAIRTLGLTGEVITTPFTFASTTHAIVENGLKPVFCDINASDYTLDASKLEALITEKTSAIIPVHVYGHVCDIKEIDRIAGKYNLKVIYDAAHAFGVEVDGQGVGGFGDISMFSFHATKVFHTIEGGALTFNDGSLKSIIAHKKNFGIISQDSVVDVGMNAKMCEFHAAMGIVNLRYIDDQISRRKILFEQYLEGLGGLNGVKLPENSRDTKPNYSYFPVVFDEKVFGSSRDDVFEALGRRNIFPRKYFYPLISDYDCYRRQFDSSLTPVARRVASSVLTLPLYASLETEKIKQICGLIRALK